MISQHAAVHDDEQARLSSALRRSLIDHAVLQPDRAGSCSNRLVDDAPRKLRSPEDVDDLDGRRDLGERAVTNQTSPSPEIRVDRKDRIAMIQEVAGHDVGWSLRAVGEPHDGDPPELPQDALFDPHAFR